MLFLLVYFPIMSRPMEPIILSRSHVVSTAGVYFTHGPQQCWTLFWSWSMWAGSDLWSLQ